MQIEEVDECLLQLLVVGEVPTITSCRSRVNLPDKIELRLREHELILLVRILVHYEDLLQLTVIVLR